jgi:hypothetical protein
MSEKKPRMSGQQRKTPRWAVGGSYQIMSYQVRTSQKMSEDVIFTKLIFRGKEPMACIAFRVGSQGKRWAYSEEGPTLGEGSG